MQVHDTSKLARVQSQEITVLEVIELYAPRPFRSTGNPKSRFLFQCPIHDGEDFNFTVTDDGQLYKCWSHCGGGNAYQLLQLLTSAEKPLAVSAPPKPQPRPKAPASDMSYPILQGATIDDLATAKGLSPEYLRDVLGWEDVTYYGTPAILMPYRNEDGPVRRLRVGISGEHKFRWERGSKVIPDGLEDLEEARAAGCLILVEGETDRAALRCAGFHVLGIPGVDTWKTEWKAYLKGIRLIYAWQEPDDAGQRLINKLSEDIPNLHVIEAPPGVKDPCDLAQQCGDGFVEFFNELLAEARPIPSCEENLDFRTCYRVIPKKELPCNKSGNVLRAYLGTLKDKLIDYYVEEADARAVEDVSQCFESYKKLICQNTEKSFLRRVHCGRRGCSVCAMWLLRQFFEDKEEVLKEHLSEQPCVYRVQLGSWRIGPFPQEKERDLKAIYKDIRDWLNQLADNYGKAFWSAKNLCYGIRCRLEGEFTCFDLILLTNYESGVGEVLKEHFSARTGIDVKVEELPCHGRRHAEETFGGFMAIPFVWDSTEDYQIWRAATKGAKLIQGKGVFYKVSGGIAKKSLTAEEKFDLAKKSKCPICGDCEPREVPGFFPVRSTQSRQVKSDITGDVYLEPIEAAA